MTVVSEKQVTIELLRTVKELEQIRNEWEKFSFHPDFEYEKHVITISTRPDVGGPLTIHVKMDGKTAGMIIGQLENKQEKLKIGYFPLGTIRVKQFAASHGGFLGSAIDLGSSTMQSILDKLLQDEQIDRAYFINLAVSWSAFASLAAQKKYKSKNTPPRKRCVLNVPGAFGDYWTSLSKNVKKNMKNYENRIKKKYSNNLVRKYKELDDLDRVMSHTEEIAKRTYHRGLDVGFMLNDETKLTYARQLKNGKRITYLMYINDEPAVFWSGARCKDTFYMETTGYLPEYRDDHLGTFLLLHSMRDLMDVEAVKKIDFGMVDTDYKKIFCNEFIDHTSIEIYANSLKGAVVYHISNMVESSEQYLRNALSKVGADRAIKNKWRRYLEKREDTQPADTEQC